MSKILRPEVQNDVPASGGITDLMDGLFYTFYNITSDELDIICENGTDEELDAFVSATNSTEDTSFITLIREGIAVRNKYVPYYQKENC
jgi:hypothetical protein